MNISSHICTLLGVGSANRLIRKLLRNSHLKLHRLSSIGFLRVSSAPCATPAEAWSTLFEVHGRKEAGHPDNVKLRFILDSNPDYA